MESFQRTLSMISKRLLGVEEAGKDSVNASLALLLYLVAVVSLLAVRHLVLI
jgi:hypothetical protein